MRGKTNKFLGILLALAMLLTSVLPSMSALAAGTAEVTLVSSAAGALKPGDVHRNAHHREQSRFRGRNVEAGIRQYRS